MATGARARRENLTQRRGGAKGAKKWGMGAIVVRFGLMFSAIRGLAVPHKRNEACPLEIAVVGERFDYAALLHLQETRAVRQAKGMVGALGVPLRGFIELFVGLGDDFYVWVVSESVEHFDRAVSDVRSLFRHMSEHFHQDHFGRDYLSPAQVFGGALSTLMLVVIWIQQSYPVTRIRKDLVHSSYFFGNPYK